MVGCFSLVNCQQASVAGGRCRTQLNKAQQCFALAKGSACSFLQVFQSRTAPKMPNEKHVLAEMHLSPATCCSCMENLRDGSVCPFALELHPACWLLPTAAVKLAALPSRAYSDHLIYCYSYRSPSRKAAAHQAREAALSGAGVAEVVAAPDLWPKGRNRQAH